LIEIESTDYRDKAKAKALKSAIHSITVEDDTFFLKEETDEEVNAFLESLTS
jgi:hypothetical protein